MPMNSRSCISNATFETRVVRLGPCCNDVIGLTHGSDGRGVERGAQAANWKRAEMPTE
eukprot:NODE_12810_length_255_cov_0.740000.p2 GENE.NODE_12810_length_255_cov_0.740000~~NODE_12810_length_255_cov_0.740000.p2  ORF type:complete len:58 (-),score=3.76 NODE_12810_length_255_cov_0.740000:65-238(-)